MVVARWLVDNGAGRVVLNGRSDPSDEQRKVLAELDAPSRDRHRHRRYRRARRGRTTGRRRRGDGTPVAWHRARRGGDRRQPAVIAMSRESLERVWAPKATGAVRLHEASLARQLDWWVGFSSVGFTVSAHLGRRPMRARAPGSTPWWRGARARGSACDRDQLGTVVGSGRGALAEPAVCWTRSPRSRGSRRSNPCWPPTAAVTGVARLRTDRALAAFPEIRDSAISPEWSRNWTPTMRRWRLGRRGRPARTRSR